MLPISISTVAIWSAICSVPTVCLHHGVQELASATRSTICCICRRRGAVNSDISVALPGRQKLVSVITRRSSENLHLEVGKEVNVILQACSVMIGVDWPIRK
jgi:molybdopterin-binding protein